MWCSQEMREGKESTREVNGIKIYMFAIRCIWYCNVDESSLLPEAAISACLKRQPCAAASHISYHIVFTTVAFYFVASVKAIAVVCFFLELSHELSCTMVISPWLAFIL